MSRMRPTVADLRAMKGKRQLTMLRVMNLDEAEAAERAGIDIVSIPPELLLDPRYRDAAPSLFSMPGENFFEIGTGGRFRPLVLQDDQGRRRRRLLQRQRTPPSSAWPTRPCPSSAMSA